MSFFTDPFYAGVSNEDLLYIDFFISLNDH